MNPALLGFFFDGLAGFLDVAAEAFDGFAPRHSECDDEKQRDHAHWCWPSPQMLDRTLSRRAAVARLEVG